MRVLVCGGRDYRSRGTVFHTLTELHPSVVIHGGCPTGADAFAQEWASPVVPIEMYAAEWDKHGKAAGPIRNQRMIDEGKPDLVVAFPGGRGTADMVRRARKAGIPVREVTTST